MLTVVVFRRLILLTTMTMLLLGSSSSNANPLLHVGHHPQQVAAAQRRQRKLVRNNNNNNNNATETRHLQLSEADCDTDRLPDQLLMLENQLPEGRCIENWVSGGNSGGTWFFYPQVRNDELHVCMCIRVTG